MQLHINHVDPAEAARTLTFAQINAALREVTQQLYGIVAARNIAISAQLPCGTAIYTTANNVAKHPQTAWDAACRAHVDWIRAHAGELLLLWADYKGVDRLDHDAVADDPSYLSACGECGTVLHSECHEENGGCPILGCGGRGMERLGPIPI